MTITKRINKNGDISFRIKVSLGYSSDGKQIISSMTYKPEPTMSPKQAEKEAYKQGIIFEEKCKRNNTVLKRVRFKDIAEEYLELIERTNKLKPSSIIRLKGLKERTYNALGNIYVHELTRRDIQNFILSLSDAGTNQRTGMGLSQKTQKHYISFISNVMNYAFDCELITDNPCKRIETIRSQKAEQSVYTLEEIKDILCLVNDKADIDYKIFFNLLAFCGIRRAEALGLEYKDIDFDTGEVNIVRTSNYQNKKTGVYTSTPKTKTGYRKLVLQPEILNLIKLLKCNQSIQKKRCKEYWHDTDRLFITWNGEPMHPNTPYTWLRRFCETEGIVFKGLKAFRHFFATQAITDGIDIKTVSSMLGHAQTSTTLNIYTHTVKKANVNGFNSVANAILA